MGCSWDRWNNGLIFLLTFVVANGVVVNLTPKTFERVVKNNEYAIVAFCVPSARSCKAFLPEFRDASKEMDSYKPRIRFATMNTDIYSNFAEEKRIVHHPTIWWFESGKFKDVYTGGRIKDSIVEWLVKQTRENFVNIETLDDLSTFKIVHDIGIFGYMPSQTLENGTVVRNENLTQFSEVAKALDVPFGRLVGKDAIQSVFPVTHSEKRPLHSMILLYRRDFKRHNESYFMAPMETLQEWVLNNYLPLVVEYSMDSAIQLYKTHVKFRLFVLVENNDKIKEALLAAAPLHRGQVTFITVSKDQDRVLTYLNSTSHDFPSAHLTTMRFHMNHYWKFDRNDFENPAAYSDFIQRALAGELQPHLF